MTDQIKVSEVSAILRQQLEGSVLVSGRKK